MSGFPCSWALLRVVPHPYTGEGAPVAVALQSRPAEFVGLRALTDADALAHLAPDADTGLLVRYLRSCEAIAAGDESAGEVALLSPPERFHWLTAPRSDVLQPGPVRHQSADDPAALLDALFQEHVAPRAGSPAGAPTRVPRWAYAVLAYLCVGVALVGVVLPGLPTVPFLLLAAWAAARGSRRLHDWLYRHPRFGAALIDWEEQGAVSTRSKAVAVALLSVSWLVMLWRFDAWVPVVAGFFFAGVATFLLSRPAPTPRSRPSRHGSDRSDVQG